MPEVHFATPVLALLPLAIGGPALKAVLGPRDGIRAIYQYGLGGLHVDNIALIQTVETLAVALCRPTPNNLAVSREALEVFANGLGGSIHSPSASNDLKSRSHPPTLATL